MDLISLLIIFPTTLMSWSLSPFSLFAFSSCWNSRNFLSTVSLNVTNVSFSFESDTTTSLRNSLTSKSGLEESCKPNYHSHFQIEYEPFFLKWSSEVQVLHCWDSIEALLRKQLSFHYRTVFTSVSLLEARHSLLLDHRISVESLFLSWSSLSISDDKRHPLHEGQKSSNLSDQALSWPTDRSCSYTFH